MAKKATLETDFYRYQAINAELRRAQQDGQYLTAIDLAISSFAYVDGMMQFDLKYGRQAQFYSVDTIDFVLKYAPLFFGYESLDQLEALLKSQRRIEKNTTANLAEALADSRATMWNAYHLWEHLEQVGKVSLKNLKNETSVNRIGWKTIVRNWEKIGIVSRDNNDSEELMLATRLEDKIRGKCPSCGATGAGTKAKLIEAITCPRCKQSVCFVLLLQ